MNISDPWPKYSPLKVFWFPINFLAFLGNVRSPSSVGQPVILAEKSEEHSYTLLEAQQQQQQQQPHLQLLSIAEGHQPARGSSTSSAEEMVIVIPSTKYCGVSCETNSFREVSPSVEPFIPERV